MNIKQECNYLLISFLEHQNYFKKQTTWDMNINKSMLYRTCINTREENYQMTT